MNKFLETKNCEEYIKELEKLEKLSKILEEKNIPIETLLEEWERLENIEDDRDCNHVSKKKIKALKDVRTIYSDREIKFIQKIIYIISDMSIYENIPQVVEIKGKHFYKPNVVNADQEDFILIEI